MPSNIRAIRSICKEIAILFGLLFLPGYLAQQSVVDSRLFESVSFHLSFWVLAVPQILIVLYVLELQDLNDKDAFGLRRFSLRALGVGMLGYVGVFLMLIPVGLFFLALPESRTTGLFGEFRFVLRNPQMLPLIILTFVGVGYREELFFRAYMIGRLDHAGVGRLPALAISTVLFALGHVYQGLSGFLVALVLGVYFGALFQRTRNLHVVAIAHALYNTTALVVYSVLA